MRRLFGLFHCTNEIPLHEVSWLTVVRTLAPFTLGENLAAAAALPVVDRVTTAAERAAQSARLRLNRRGGLAGVILAAVTACAPAFAACPVGHGPFGTSRMTPDGARLICLVDVIPGKYELFTVAGGTPPVRLSPETAADRDVIAFEISPDGQRVAFTFDPAQWTKYELWTVPAAGGDARKVNGHLPLEHDVDRFYWSGDSQRVVWVQGRNTTGDWTLRSASPAGAGAVLLSPAGYTVGRTFSIVWGGRSVCYQAEPLGGPGVMPWYVVPVAGGTALRVLFTDGFESGGLGAWQ